jgi:sarcosine oxidase gamma subunit
MARPEPQALLPLARAQIGAWAAVLPTSRAALTVRVVEPVQVLSLRHHADGAAALVSALAEHAVNAMESLPAPAHFVGIEPCVVWRSVSECLFIATAAATCERLLSALRPNAGAPAVAVDVSAGSVVLELLGSDVQQTLCRLADATAMPTVAGRATRLRLADIAVVVLCHGPTHYRLVIDRAHDAHLANWLAYAAARDSVQR